MGSHKQTFKKVWTHDLAGTTGVTVDGIFTSGNLYLFTGDTIYTTTNASHHKFSLRYNENDYELAYYSRSAQVMQHGQGSIIHQGSHNTTVGGSVGYAGSAATEAAAFKFWIKPGSIAELSGSYYYDSIGHVNGTGFRIQQEGGALITDEKVHGFTFKQTSGYTYTSGNLNLYQLDFDQIKMVDNV